ASLFYCPLDLRTLHPFPTRRSSDLGKLAEIFVHLLQAGSVFELGLFLRNRLILTLEKLLGGLPPRPEVVFVEDHEIPLDLVEPRSEEHTSELQSLRHLVCRLLPEKK